MVSKATITDLQNEMHRNEEGKQKKKYNISAPIPSVSADGNLYEISKKPSSPSRHRSYLELSFENYICYGI